MVEQVAAPAQAVGTPARARRPHGWVLPASLLILLAVGCVPPLPEPRVVITAPPGVAAILTAREALGQDVVIVAQDTIALPDRVAAVRHTSPRGAAQVAMAAEVASEAEELAQGSARLRETAASLTDGRVLAAAELADDLATVGSRAVEEARADLDALAPFMQLDMQMDEVVAAWDQRGSRLEQQAAFTALAEQAAGLILGARQLPSAPCVGLRANRMRWADLVALRTATLRDATSLGSGTRFDALRADYRRAPYGEDRQVADAESAACWERTSILPDLRDQADDILQRLPASLSG